MVVEYATIVSAEQESAELVKIAARANDPQLAFATDEDVGVAIDPTVNHSDLGSDPLAFFRRRMKLSQELWQRLEQRPLSSGESYSALRRRFLTGFTQMGYAMARGEVRRRLRVVTTPRNLALPSTRSMPPSSVKHCR